MRILFLGTPEFAVASLRRLVESGHNVVGVVTAPDKPAGRGQKLHESDVKKYAVSVGLPVFQPEKLRDPEFLEQIGALKPDLGIVIAFRMLPQVVGAMPRLGTFILHASLLPQYRGAAPINRAIMNGETETGLTTFMLDSEIDMGAIAGQVKMEVGPTENAGSLHDRMMERGAELVLQTVEKISAGGFEPVPQPTVAPENLKPAPKIFKDDCRLDPTWTGKKIADHIRGLSPYPGAWVEIVGVSNGVVMVSGPGVSADSTVSGGANVLKIFEARFTVSKPAGGLSMRCSDGWIEILELQPAGKRRMSAKEFLNGVR
jgi:methionyl-tRNA formyltransferase